MFGMLTSLTFVWLAPVIPVQKAPVKPVLALASMPVTTSERTTFRSGAGRLCLDFVRTLRYRGRPWAEEELSGDGRLGDWVRQFGPCDQATDRDESGRVEEARRLREAITLLITCALGAGGARSCPTEAREAVNAAAAAAVPTPELDGAGRVIHRADSVVEATLALVARDAIDLVSSSDLLRVRPCSNPECQVLFLDGSRPGRRRWCSMDTCGNRAKKATQLLRADRDR
jgi:predicted RNA-binding Zn ribbon-like protein